MRGSVRSKIIPANSHSAHSHSTHSHPAVVAHAAHFGHGLFNFFGTLARFEASDHFIKFGSHLFAHFGTHLFHEPRHALGVVFVNVAQRGRVCHCVHARLFGFHRRETRNQTR